MLHPSYQELIDEINIQNREQGVPEINSRYSLVIAASKRARAIVDGRVNSTVQLAGTPEESRTVAKDHPLSAAVKEMQNGNIYVYTEEA